MCLCVTIMLDFQILNIFRGSKCDINVLDLLLMCIIHVSKAINQFISHKKRESNCISFDSYSEVRFSLYSHYPAHTIKMKWQCFFLCVPLHHFLFSLFFYSHTILTPPFNSADIVNVRTCVYSFALAFGCFFFSFLFDRAKAT